MCWSRAVSWGPGEYLSQESIQGTEKKRTFLRRADMSYSNVKNKLKQILYKRGKMLYNMYRPNGKEGALILSTGRIQGGNTLSIACHKEAMT